MAHVVNERLITSDAFFKVLQRAWAKKSGLKFKAIDRTTFLFYFEVADDLEYALYKSPRNFNISLVIVKKLEARIQPSQIDFIASPFWLQVHNLRRKTSIVTRIVERAGKLLELHL